MVCVCRVFKKTLPPPASGTTTVAQFLTPSPSPPSQPTLPSIGNNLIVKKSLATAQSSGLLTSVYESGLLSKAQAAGVSLSSLEPLLKLASENPDVLLLLESAGPDVLPLLPTILSAAPKALPILGALVGTPPPLIASGAVLGPAAAFAIANALPDDSVGSVALQVVAAGILGVAVPGISLVGYKVLGDLTK